MSDQQLQTTEQIIEQKRAAWGKMGVGVHSSELALQAKAQEIINTLVLPTEIEKIPQAEEALRVAKKNVDDLTEERKKVTGRLNAVIDRLMLPEKSVAPKIQEFTTGLLQLKKQADEQGKKQQLKQQELKQIAEKIRIYIADLNAAFLKDLAKLISDSYEHALKLIPPEQIDPYLAKVSARVTEAKYTMQKPVLKATYATQEEVNAEVDKLFKPTTANEYIDGFAIDLKNKYSDYKLAWDNKEQALELNKREAQENASAIQQQQQQDIVAANVQAMAATPTIGYGGKSVKEVYKLTMEETFEDANIVIMAYLANSDKCKNKLQITKWLTGFGVKQMIGALEKLRNDDPKFDFDGLKWIIENKL